MKWGGVLMSSIFLARRLRKEWAGQEMVGILLPPSVPAALVNYAAMLAGKIPVNLNYTLPDEALASCAAQCKIETVVTTKLLLEKIPLTVPGRTILIEEAAAAPRLGEKLMALLLWILPGASLERSLSGGTTKSLDDLATIIFSSGSTGEPKGVMLTHYNIASNIEQVGQTFMFDSSDSLLGVLPFFHSFGFTVTLWLPAVLGVAAAYHPSPLDLNAVSETGPRLSHHVSCSPRPRFCKPICGGAHRKISAACNMWLWARKNCRSGWRSRSKTVSAFARSKVTAPRNARPLSL